MKIFISFIYLEMICLTEPNTLWSRLIDDLSKLAANLTDHDGRISYLRNEIANHSQACSLDKQRLYHPFVTFSSRNLITIHNSHCLLFSHKTGGSNLDKPSATITYFHFIVNNIMQIFRCKWIKKTEQRNEFFFFLHLNQTPIYLFVFFHHRFHDFFLSIRKTN